MDFFPWTCPVSHVAHVNSAHNLTTSCLRKLYLVLALFWNCFLLFSLHTAISFTERFIHSLLRLPWFHRPLLALTLAISFPEQEILAAVQNLVDNFSYPHCSSLKLFQQFCTLFEMRGPQQHAMFNVWEQPVDLHSSIMMLSVLLFIPFLEIANTDWICLSYCFWELSSILMELTILRPRS